MPVFGKSLFETVLEGLDAQQEEAEEGAALAVRGFNGGFVGPGWNTRSDTESDPALWFEAFLPDALPPSRDVPPPWLDRLSEAEIAEDLGLPFRPTEQDIRDKRRLFALDNHPDRVLPDYREQATRRMMIANQLLDSALGRLR